MVDPLAAPRRRRQLCVVVNAGAQGGRLRPTSARACRPASRLDVADDRALLALQGPEAAAVLARHLPGGRRPRLHDRGRRRFDGIDCSISRSGYTGEDGFEISVAGRRRRGVWPARCSPSREVKPIGLGARDSLRLEAGLCLYGHDLDETDLAGRGRSRLRRRQAPPRRGRLPRLRRASPANSPTAPPRVRVGLLPDGKAPGPRRRRRSPISPAAPIGVVTSGGFGPTVGGPIAMGYVEPAFAAPGTKLALSVRGKRTCRPPSTALPFVPHRYVRKPILNEVFEMTTRYTRDHEWVRLEGDLAVVGISNYAQEQLGDIVFVELPESARSSTRATRRPSSNR